MVHVLHFLEHFVFTCQRFFFIWKACCLRFAVPKRLQENLNCLKKVLIESRGSQLSTFFISSHSIRRGGSARLPTSALECVCLLIENRQKNRQQQKGGTSSLGQRRKRSDQILERKKNQGLSNQTQKAFSHELIMPSKNWQMPLNQKKNTSLC